MYTMLKEIWWSKLAYRTYRNMYTSVVKNHLLLLHMHIYLGLNVACLIVRIKGTLATILSATCCT